MIEKSNRQYIEEIKTLRRQMAYSEQQKSQYQDIIEKLTENEKLYRDVAENNPDWAFWLNADDRLIYMSPSCQRFTGYEPDDFKKDAKLLFKIIHPDDRTAFDEHLRFMHKAKTHVEEEFRIVRKDKKTRWLNHVCQPVYDAEGQYAGILCSNRDITDTKDTGNASEASGKLYRLLAENMSDVVWTMDVAFQQTYISPSVEQLRGYTAEEAVDQNLRDALTPSSFQSFNEIWSAEIAQERSGKATRNRPLTLQLEFQCKNGSTVWTETTLTPLRNEDKKIIEILGVSRDITLAKQTGEMLAACEEKLRQNDNQLTALLNAATESIFVIDTEGRVLFANEVTASRLGTDLETLLQKGDINDFIPPDVGVKRRHLILQSQKTGKPVHFQDELQDRLMSNTVYPILGKDGKVAQLAVFSADITERKAAESADQENRLKHAETERLLQQIIDVMPVRVYWKDKRSNYLGANQPFARDAGREKPQDLVGDVDQNMSWRAQADILREDDLAVMRGQVKINCEELQTDPDGQRRWFNTTKVPLTDAEGRTIGVLGIYEDITRQKRTEEELTARTSRIHQLDHQIHQLKTQMHQSENYMRQSEKKMQALLDAATESIFLTDVDGKVLYANETAALRLNTDLATLLAGRSIYEFVSPEIGDRRRQYVAEVQKSGQSIRFEEERSGRTILNSLYPIPGENGKVTQLAFFGLDITDLKTAEAAIEESERHTAEANRMLRQVIDTIPVRIFWKDQNSVYQGGNLLFARDLGRDYPESLIGYTDQSFVSRKQAEQYHQDDQDVMASGKPKINYEEQQTAPDGKQIWRRTTKVPLADAEGRMIGVLGVYDDITDQKTATEALAESEKRYRSLFENNRMAMLLIDSESGAIMDANPAAAVFYGWSREELMRKKISSINMLSAREISKKMKLALTHDSNHAFFKHKRADGSIRDVEIFSSVQQFRGKPAHCAMIYDITERIQMEDALRQSEKLDSLGILAGGIAHDFNNLMTIVQGNIDVALLTLPEEDAACQSLQAAQDAVERTRDITNRLITFSRGGTPVAKVCRMENLLAETAKNSLKSSPVELSLDTPAGLWPVEVDPSQIKQCFSHLVDNAREAMPEGGTLTIRAENADITDSDALPLIEGPYLKITFEDNGTGIPAEHIARIFDPYYTTKPMGTDKGMGLGLAVCHSVLKKHGGYITVNSEEGRGATFSLYLPAKPGFVVEEEPPAVENIPPVRRILIMDDNEDILRILQIYIEKLGFDVTGVANGQEVIRQYQEAREADDAFSAVFMEISVKQGLGGEAALAKLRAIDPDVKAVAILSEYGDSQTQKFLDRGFQDVLGKPFRLEDMKKVLKSILES
ncbi:MAG: PAS domain S-box protein [Deltaproteobacteria bacterium]